MKFAKVLQQTLIEEEIPEEWVGAAIQYKMLKKCINEVVHELNLLGLENNNLKLLLEEPTKKIVEVEETATCATNPVIAEYSLSKSKNSDIIKPTLKITIDYSHQDYTDDHIAELGVVLKDKIEQMLNEGSLEGNKNIVELNENHELILSPQNTHSLEEEEEGGEEEGEEEKYKGKKKSKKNEITIVMNSDSKFFSLLEEELQNLDQLKQREEMKLMEEVEKITDVVRSLKDTSNIRKSDLYNWREIFRIYLDSEVYFKYNKASPGTERSAEQIKHNLEEFLRRVDQSRILKQFKNKQSLVTYQSFVQMNDHLLKVLTFQAINSTALRKILKKFDKQTSLGVKEIYPKLVSNDHIFIGGESIAQHICYVMQTGLLQLIPQLDDYTCPICMQVAFKPIRLVCGHVFCVRCLVKLKQEVKVNCPICRFQNAISMADSGNIDYEQLYIMQKWFPIEVKQKLRERNKERYDEVVGNNHKCALQ